MAIQDILNDYKTKTTTYLQYVGKAFAQDSKGKYYLAAKEQSFVVESTFLRIFVSWETFLEDVFVGYLMGNPSAAGRSTVRYAHPLSESHARQLLIGTQKYIDWANPEIVRTLANLYFERGEPIGTSIASIQTDLIDLKIVRNAAAHMSSTSSRALDGLAIRKLSRNFQSISVCDFLLALDPYSSVPNTILNAYVSLLDAASYNIVNWS